MQSQTGELTYQKVDFNNLPLLLEIYHRVWPRKAPHPDYLAKPKYPDDDTNVSWIVYHNNSAIGIVGVYNFDPDEPGYDQGESIWMDHFAILPEFRRHGFGKQVLLDTINYCRSLNRFKYYRLDTVYFDGRPALALYDQLLPLREEYTAEDTLDKKQHYLIYSYSLDSSPIKPWDNHFLGLGDSQNDLIVV